MSLCWLEPKLRCFVGSCMLVLWTAGSLQLQVTPRNGPISDLHSVRIAQSFWWVLGPLWAIDNPNTDRILAGWSKYSHLLIFHDRLTEHRGFRECVYTSDLIYIPWVSFPVYIWFIIGSVMKFHHCIKISPLSWSIFYLNPFSVTNVDWNSSHQVLLLAKLIYFPLK